VVDRALVVAEPESPDRPFQWASRCGELLVLLAAGSQSAWVFEPEDAQSTLHQVWLPGVPTCRPVVWNDKLLVATSDAQVWLFDPHSGAAAAAPFQGAITADAMPGFRGLAVVDENQAVVCDRRGRLWRLRLQQQPVPCLTGSPAAGNSPVGSAPAVVGGSVFALDQGGRLARFELPELEPQPAELQATEPAWGPLAAGGRIWLADASGRLACVSAAGELLWEVTIEGGPLRAAPLVDGQSVWLPTAHCAVVRLALETGEQLGRVQIGRVLTSGVLRCGGRLVVCTADGALVEVGPP